MGTQVESVLDFKRMPNVSVLGPFEWNSLKPTQVKIVLPLKTPKHKFCRHQRKFQNVQSLYYRWENQEIKLTVLSQSLYIMRYIIYLMILWLWSIFRIDSIDQLPLLFLRIFVPLELSAWHDFGLQMSTLLRNTHFLCLNERPYISHRKNTIIASTFFSWQNLWS